jgi:hypothetical protein
VEEEVVVEVKLDLIEGVYDEYPGTKKKILQRILSNPNKLIKSYFSVNTFLETDEEFFIKNTNRI